MLYKVVLTFEFVYSVTIQMKAYEQHVHAVLSVFPYFVK